MKHFPPKVVVVATDLSEASQSAIDAAAWLAEAHGATLHLVHVYDPLPFHAPTALQGPSRAMEEAAAEVRAGAAKALEELRAARLAELDVETHELSHDDPGEAIAEHAQASKADLIVVGSHGRRGLRRMLLGSVAERVSRLARCPVLVVRPEGETPP